LLEQAAIGCSSPARAIENGMAAGTARVGRRWRGGIIAPLACAGACAIDDRVPAAVGDDPDAVGATASGGNAGAAPVSGDGPGLGSVGSANIPPNVGRGGSGGSAMASANGPMDCARSEAQAGCVNAMGGASGASGQPGFAAPAEPLPPSPPVSLTISNGGSAPFGVVRVEPLGVTCTNPPCTLQVPSGVPLELVATTDSASGNGVSSWTGGGCSGGDDCRLVVTSDTLVSVAFEPANLVFVSSVATTANLGGLAGADAFCTGLAQNAGLPGSFIALLPNDGVNAFDRIGNFRGWARPDGKLVVDTVDDFRAGRLLHPLRIDESGDDVGDVRVMTGMAPGGEVSIASGDTSCEGWTSEGSGTYESTSSALMGSGFTSFGSDGCGTAAPLYCVGIGRNVHVAPTPAVGRFAFTSWNVQIGNGLAALDAVCQSHAQEVGLPGTYLALLATTTASAASRFDLNGLPWVRPDGIRIAASAAALFQSSLLDSAPNQSAIGFEYHTNEVNWFGATSLTAVGSVDTTCNDWLSRTGTASGGRSGMSAIAALIAFDASNPCDFDFGVVTCLQQ
jgi:hypothetical protein